MPDIDVVGDVGASFQVDATFNISDVDSIGDFTKTLLTEESFDWIISGTNLSGKQGTHAHYMNPSLTDLSSFRDRYASNL